MLISGCYVHFALVAPPPPPAARPETVGKGGREIGLCWRVSLGKGMTILIL